MKSKVFNFLVESNVFINASEKKCFAACYNQSFTSAVHLIEPIVGH